MQMGGEQIRIKGSNAFQNPKKMEQWRQRELIKCATEVEGLIAI